MHDRAWPHLRGGEQVDDAGVLHFRQQPPLAHDEGHGLTNDKAMPHI